MRRALAFGRVALCAAVVVPAAHAGIACVDLDSLGSVPLDAGLDAPAGDVNPPVPDPCVHAVPPGPPDRDDDPNTRLEEFVVAIANAIIDPRKVPGFDLDGICTCDDRPGTKLDGGTGCVNPSAGEAVCDLPRAPEPNTGSDNAIAVVARDSTPENPIADVTNRLISQGQRTVLIQIIDYNGLANDTDISVGAFLAEGIREKGCPLSVLNDATQTWTPGNCGSDAWTVSNATLVGSRTTIKGKGYVNGYELVARFDETVQPLLPFTADTVIPFRRAIVYGKLVPLDETLSPRDETLPPTPAQQRLYKVERGILAGRVTVPDVLRGIGSFRPGGGAPLCASGVFTGVATTICAKADVRADDLSITSPCTALSAAAGFEAWPALIGAPVASPAPAECSPAALVCPPL